VLAAAWAPVRSCAELADELAAAADVPEAPLRGLPERQRRVRAVLRASWDRLSAADQAVLRSLPLFRGGFTRAAARAVVGASPQQLLRLLDLLLVSVSAGHGERYELPALVARYAAHQQAGRPEEGARLAARHAAYFADYVQERAAALPRSQQAVAELERERPNIMAAREWAAAQGQVELLERMRPGLLLFHRLTASPVRPAAGVESALQTRPGPPPAGGGRGLGGWEPARAAPRAEEPGGVPPG
jgi:hypothetical protein